MLEDNIIIHVFRKQPSLTCELLRLRNGSVQTLNVNRWIPAEDMRQSSSRGWTAFHLPTATCCCLPVTAPTSLASLTQGGYRQPLPCLSRRSGNFPPLSFMTMTSVFLINPRDLGLHLTKISSTNDPGPGSYTTVRIVGAVGVYFKRAKTVGRFHRGFLRLGVKIL